MVLDSNTVADFSWSQLFGQFATYSIVCGLLYAISVSIYRLTFHPLAKFPGPWLAGATYAYEFWYEVIQGAQYNNQLPGLHERYGPIVRISPDELHCNDPNFVDVLYSTGNHKRNKPKHYTMGWGSASFSAFGTVDHTHHRIRRSVLNKFFSRGRVIKVEDFIHEKAQLLCDKFLSFRGRGAFDLTGAFNCFTTDTVTEYCFGSSTGFLEQDGWEPNCKSSIEVVESMTHMHRHMPWVRYARKWAPLWLVKRISSSWYDFLVYTRVKTPERIDRVEAVFQTNGAKNCPVFLELLNSDLPPQEKTMERLTYESNGVTMAGPATTAITLSHATYYLLAHPEAHHKLREELLTKINDPRKLPRWSELEGLPYLSAVINESLRMLPDGVGERFPYDTSQERLPRISPEEDIKFESPSGDKSETTIPRGYAIGMSAALLHADESIFPNASQFIPERWLDEKGQRNRAPERYLIAFSRGARQCLGMQVAYCELYVALAAVALRVLPYLELCDTKSAEAGPRGFLTGRVFTGNMVRVSEA